MIQECPAQATDQSASITIEIDPDLVSVEALLKTTYWFSRDFHCDIRREEGRLTATLIPKSAVMRSETVRQDFMDVALDFSLRERVNVKTAGVRDLLLAKAFSESGVLEDAPEGIFGDVLEESKPDGMFKILNNR